MSIAIVTDSTADLPLEAVQAYGIRIVPATLVVEGQAYQDGEGITREEFYQRLPAFTKPPTTSAPSIGIFHNIYEKLFQEGVTQILSIHVASAFSGIHDIACVAAESFKNRIKVFDSQQVSLGLGFQVLAAAEAAARGHSIEEIVQGLTALGDRVHFYALLDTVEYLGRSGRVHWAAAAIGGLLNLKVLIEVRKGQVLRKGLFRAHRQGFHDLLNSLHKLGTLERLALVYTTISNQDEIKELVESVSSRLHSPPIITPVTTVIGTHVGPNGIGFIAVSA